jgi:choline dehydrogenase
VTLNPADPMGPPTIDPRYLTTDWDMFVMRTAIRSTIRYMSAPVWAQFNTTPVFDPSVADTDELLDAFIRDNAFGGMYSWLEPIPWKFND